MIQSRMYLSSKGFSRCDRGVCRHVFQRGSPNVHFTHEEPHRSPEDVGRSLRNKVPSTPVPTRSARGYHKIIPRAFSKYFSRIVLTIYDFYILADLILQIRVGG